MSETELEASLGAKSRKYKFTKRFIENNARWFYRLADRYNQRSIVTIHSIGDKNINFISTVDGKDFPRDCMSIEAFIAATIPLDKPSHPLTKIFI